MALLYHVRERFQVETITKNEQNNEKILARRMVVGYIVNDG